MTLLDLRRDYHRRVGTEIMRSHGHGMDSYLNFADSGSKGSRTIAEGIASRLGYTANQERVSGQTAGRRFEDITRSFLEESFALLAHLRPGKWCYSTQMAITSFDQYEHLAALENLLGQHSELESALGRDHIITPDIVIGRWPVTDDEINQHSQVVTSAEHVSLLTPIRQANLDVIKPILHASVSCKWTLRSDRGQNARTEALNLVRSRKGHVPHIVAVTAEPLPTRVASLALGTGDLDCVYHLALPELESSVQEANNEDQMDMLRTLVEGRRLRDIRDLPFDLAA